MKALLDESQPIFQQIAQQILDEIVDGRLGEEERVPSENDLSLFYGINRATVRKGLQQLVDQNIIYKQRGIGMFVSQGARAQLLNERQKGYREAYVRPLLLEARRIGVSMDTLMEWIREEEKEC